MSLIPRGLTGGYCYNVRHPCSLVVYSWSQPTFVVRVTTGRWRHGGQSARVTRRVEGVERSSAQTARYIHRGPHVHWWPGRPRVQSPHHSDARRRRRRRTWRGGRRRRRRVIWPDLHRFRSLQRLGKRIFRIVRRSCHRRHRQRRRLRHRFGSRPDRLANQLALINSTRC